MDADNNHLEYLLGQFKEVINKLNTATEELGELKSRVQIKDAEVKKYSNMYNLVQEQIRVEKKKMEVR